MYCPHCGSFMVTVTKWNGFKMVKCAVHGEMLEKLAVRK